MKIFRTLPHVLAVSKGREQLAVSWVECHAVKWWGSNQRIFHVMEEPNFIVKARASSPQSNWLWCTLLTAHQQDICSVSSRNFQITISVPLSAHLHCFLPPSSAASCLLPSTLVLYQENQKYFSLPYPPAAFPFPSISYWYLWRGLGWEDSKVVILKCTLGQIGFTPLICLKLRS